VPRKGIKGKRLITLLSLLILLSLALMTVNIKRDQRPFFFESLIASIISPVQVIFTQATSSVAGVFEHYFFVVDSARENKELRKQIDKLSDEKNELVERVKRQGRIANLLPQEEPQISKLLVATVIGRDATQWSKVVFIDKGTEQGVRENLAVMTHAGAIGHIIQSTGTTSKVLLITDSRSAVDSLFQDSRVTGVAVGTGKNLIKVKYVPMNARVAMGDSIISSGLGGTFPKGLKIGVVSQVVKMKQGLFQNITVKPSAEFLRLEEVLVRMP
jgi:rod shape-determining protein MreC